MMPTEWLRQTKKRIDLALLCDRLHTPGRMFLSSIGERLDRYHDNTHLSEAQHRKLVELLVIAERNNVETTNRRDRVPRTLPSTGSPRPQKKIDVGIDPKELHPEPQTKREFIDLSQYFDASPDDLISVEPLQLK